MSPTRVAILLRKELVHGSKNLIFLFAVLMPIVVSVALSLVFGTLFSEKPRLGIADEGDSQMVRLATGLESVIVKEYPASSELKAAVKAGAVDMGIVLPQGFDHAIAQGQITEITAYIWGESLARNRVILGVTLANIVIDLVGHEVPVEISTTTLGNAQNIPWNDRLLPIMVLMAVFLGGIMIPGTSLVEEKHKRTLTALTTTPTTLEEVFLTKGLVGVIISLSMGVVTLALNQAFGAQPLLLLLVLTLGSIMAAELGILLGIMTKDITSLFATIKSLGVLLYAPALIYLFPQIPEWIGKVFPTYYIVQPVVEISQRGATWSDIAFEVLVLIGLIVVLLGVVTVIARRVRQREAYSLA